MRTLDEIEAATDKLSDLERGRLLAFLQRRLSTTSDAIPPPRDFSIEEMNGWLAEDEADMRRIRERSCG